MAIDVRPGSIQTVLVLHGSFDEKEADRLHDALLEIDPDRPVTIDFHDVRLFHDTAVARLPRELAGRHATLLGLSEHHYRLLRYVGLPFADRHD